jgi:methionyl-tRNA formyltransferase
VPQSSAQVNIVFFGTPEFAVPSLRALLGEGFRVAAVVTQPDRPQGRSRSRRVPPPVKEVALEEGLPVLQPDKPSDPAFLDQLRELKPDLGVVVAYGHILRPQLLEIPRLGMINVHGSLLPRLRGAAPIQRAIMEGASQSGISIMQLDEGMDTGPVLLQIAIRVEPDETFGELHTRLAEIGALGLVEALTMLQLGTADAVPQDHSKATYAPKITRESSRISWADSATAVARLVRAMDPAPGAWSTLKGKEVKLFGPAEAEWPPAGTAPGTVLESHPTLVVATGEGALGFLEAKPAGGRRMPVADWARGRGVSVNQIFE